MDPTRNRPLAPRNPHPPQRRATLTSQRPLQQPSQQPLQQPLQRRPTLSSQADRPVQHRRHSQAAPSLAGPPQPSRTMAPPPPGPIQRITPRSIGLYDDAPSSSLPRLSAGGPPPVAPGIGGLSPRTQFDLQDAQLRGRPDLSRKEYSERRGQNLATAMQGQSRINSRNANRLEEVRDIERSIVAEKTGNYGPLYPDRQYSPGNLALERPTQPLRAPLPLAVPVYKQQYGANMGGAPAYQPRPAPFPVEGGHPRSGFESQPISTQQLETKQRIDKWMDSSSGPVPRRPQ